MCMGIIYGVGAFLDEATNSSLKELVKQLFEGYRKLIGVEDIN